VLILGGGYAGLRLALDFSSQVAARGINAAITLVDRESNHQIITELHRIATESLPRARGAIAFRDIIPSNLNFLCDEVTTIDADRRMVRTGDHTLKYDRLVIALGSEPRLPPIPGLEEDGLRLRSLADAEKLRLHIRDCFAAAAKAVSPLERRACLRILIAGGGFTGCQLAGELAHWVTDLADEYAVSVSDIHLLLIEAAPTLLPGGEASDGRKAHRILCRKGVDVRLGTRLLSLEPGMVTFGEERLNCRTVVWTGGVSGPSVLRGLAFPLDPMGRCRVDGSLRTVSFPEVYAAGDCAGYQLHDRTLPAAAAVAVRQGAFIARALADDVTGRPVARYVPLDTGLLVSLGGNDAVGDLLGVPVDGPAGGLVKEGIEAWYALTARNLTPLTFY